MEKITLFEQDLINAVCEFHARFRNVNAADVEVELTYEDNVGYGAEAYVNGQTDAYNQVNFITAVRLFIDQNLQRDSMAARIQFDIDDEHGMVAYLEF